MSEQDFDAAAAGTSEDLARTVGWSLRWSVINLAILRVGSLLSGIVMARLLEPADFGLFAIALVVANALLEINDLGIMNALIRAQNDPRELVPTGVTLTFLSSCVLYVLTFIAAPFIATVVHMPDATSLIRVIGLLVMIDGVSAIPAALLTRSFRQDKRAVADVTGFVISMTVTIAMALAGAGAWSFVVGRLAGNFTGGVLVFLVTGIRIRPGYNRVAARELLHFGLPLAAAGVVNFALLNTDYLIVGRTLGVVELGLYVLAFNLSSFPVNVLTMAIRRVSIAAYGRHVGDKERLATMLLESIHLIAIGAALLTCLLAAAASPLINVLYGERWSAAATALALLSLMGGIRVVANLAQDFFAAVARTRLVLLIQIVWLVVLVPSLALGARWHGINGVAFAHAAVATAVALPCLMIGLPVASGVSVAAMIRVLIRPLVAGTLGVIVGRWTLRFDLPELLQLAVCLMAASLAFAVVALRGRELRAARLFLASGKSTANAAV